MSEWRNKRHVFDLLSDEEINEAKIAKSVVKRGGSLKFMFEIKNNPQKYPNLSKLKNDALRILHDELGSQLPKEELPDPRFIDLPTEEESTRQYELDKQLEFANTNKGVKKMKIKLSKSQWEMVGRKAGWMKISSPTCPKCNAPLNPSTNTCPFCSIDTKCGHCGLEFDHNKAINLNDQMAFRKLWGFNPCS